MTLPTLFRGTDLGISYYFQMIIGREMKTVETAAHVSKVNVRNSSDRFSP